MLKQIQIMTILIFSVFILSCGKMDSGISSISKEDQPLQADLSPGSPGGGNNTNTPLVPTIILPNEIVLTGNCPTGAISVTISTPVNQTVNCINGQFAATIILTGITDGSYNLTLNFNIGPNGNQDLILDHSQAQLNITNYQQGRVIPVTQANVNNLELIGTCRSSMNEVIIQIGNITINSACNNNTFNSIINLSALSNGLFRGSLSQADTNGNKFIKYFEVFKDTTNPVYLANHLQSALYRQLQISASIEGQNVKSSVGGGYVVISSMGQPLPTLKSRIGTGGYIVEGYLRSY